MKLWEKESPTQSDVKYQKFLKEGSFDKSRKYVVTHYLKKEIVAEILKCGKDPVYFIDNYARISHPTRRFNPLQNLSISRRICCQDFNDYRFNVILKARQLGYFYYRRWLYSVVNALS